MGSPGSTSAICPPRFAATSEPRTCHPPVAQPVKPLDELLTEIERRLIETALSKSRQNKSRAAELLGISRPRLYRRIKELNLPDDSEVRERGCARCLTTGRLVSQRGVMNPEQLAASSSVHADDMAAIAAVVLRMGGFIHRS